MWGCILMFDSAPKIPQSENTLDNIDRKIILATQNGLPLVPRPYHQLAEELGIDAETIISRIKTMQETGLIRRIGVVPNHYKLGYHANGMSVWDITDKHIHEAGQEIAALPFVSHCYQRPRHLPHWPFNLFAMLHAHSRDEVEKHIEQMIELLGERRLTHDVIYSRRILKKTGLRLITEK